VRNYVTLGSGRTLVPTPLGVVLVHGYHRIDSALVLPQVRATIEEFCNMIARGEASKDEV
jgi:DNA topoisomerase-3